MQKVSKKIKDFVNSIRIPRLLSFFITKNGKINPSLEETLQDASPKDKNWTRIGLGKTAIGPLKRWHIFLIPVLMWIVSFSSEALQRTIGIARDLILLIPLALVLYYIFKDYFKK